MKIIEEFLKGELDVMEFAKRLKVDQDLQEEVRNLIPKEAIEQSDHPLWSRISFEGYKKDHFDCLEHINRICRFDGSYGDNLNIFGPIQRIYSVIHPAVSCTKKYEEAFALYLNTTQDCYDGSEVENVVRQVVNDVMFTLPKKGRLDRAKKRIKKEFHVVGGRRPHWIQSPEWPMGKESPMQFVEQKKIKEGKCFVFRDCDTGEYREISQYY